MIIIGEKEVKSKTISVRRRFEGDLGTMKIHVFINNILDEIKNKGVDNRQRKKRRKI